MLLGKPLNEDINLRPIHYNWVYEPYNQSVANTRFLVRLLWAKIYLIGKR